MLEWLVILGLVAVVIDLTRKLRVLEGRLHGLETRSDFSLQVPADPSDAFAEPPAAEPEPDPLTNAEMPAEAVALAEPQPIALELPPAEAVASEEPGSRARRRAALSIDFEELFGRRLPIWAGGVALAVAGVFLVRYAVERGVITPTLRVALAFAFGIALLTGAEAAYRGRRRVADPRVGQALAGAGLATLYAAFYLGGSQYGLIGQTLAFLGLGGVTAGAIVLSYRFGLPSAVLGLVGGFAAPALVGGEEANLPLLALYLGLVTAGLVLTGRHQHRSWLGIAALVGGLGWGALLLAAGRFGTNELLALGLYFVVLGAVLPALADAPRFAKAFRAAAALAASVQLALLVAAAGYTMLGWGLYLLLGAALAALGWNRPFLRDGSAVAAAVALALLALWGDVGAADFAPVAVALAAIFALVPLALIWRGADRLLDNQQLAAVAAALAAIVYLRFGKLFADTPEVTLAVVTVTLALVPSAAAWAVRARQDARPFALHTAIAGALAFAALLMVTPGWAAPLAGAGVCAALFAALSGRDGTYSIAVVWASALASILALLLTDGFATEFARLLGGEAAAVGVPALLRWLAVAAVVAALAWRDADADRRRFAESAVTLFLYGALAQLLPRDLLGWAAALLAVGARLTWPTRPAAALMALALAAAWALQPLGWWLDAGLESLRGDPMFSSEVPDPADVATRLLPILAALVLTWQRPFMTTGGSLPRALPGATLALAIVVGHSLFKHVFAIEDGDRFVAYGMAERTVWEATLLLGAVVAARLLPIGRVAGNALAGSALAHFVAYTGLAHNPLWSPQALGPLPIANLALVAYGIAIATSLWLRRNAPRRIAPVWDAGVMLLASMAALTLLRQAFAGSLPMGVPLTPAEDLLRSLAGILLALFFLWLGSRRQERSWRIGSLAVMLAAVAKVFLVDAAGLDGLLRVASFMALGFSLIGIGWVYARQLRAPAEA